MRDGDDAVAEPSCCAKSKGMLGLEGQHEDSNGTRGSATQSLRSGMIEVVRCRNGNASDLSDPRS